MDFLRRIAEERIQEAIQRGEFDDLPGRGKPLKLEDLSGVPEDLRVGFKILKNAGVLPPELELRKEILRLQDLIRACTCPQETQGLRRRLSTLRLHYKILMER